MRNGDKFGEWFALRNLFETKTFIRTIKDDVLEAL